MARKEWEEKNLYGWTQYPWTHSWYIYFYWVSETRNLNKKVGGSGRMAKTVEGGPNMWCQAKYDDEDEMKRGG